MYLFENMRRQPFANKMKNLFASLDIAYDKSTPQNFLQRLGVMHLGAVIGASAKCLQSIKIALARLSTLAPESFQSLEGLPADFAFTIFNLFHLVHYFLTRKGHYENAALLCNYIWKNYAYKLHATKRVAFMANFFASLHYDYPYDSTLDSIVKDRRSSNLRYIKEIGKYVIIKFDKNYTVIPENRIYVTFVRLILADLKRHEFTRERFDFADLILQAELDKPILDQSLAPLWIFLGHFSKMIQEEKSFFHGEFKKVLFPACQLRWRKAIVTRNFYDHLGRQKTKLVARWRKRLGRRSEHILRQYYEC